ncbi:hypothetical protein [Streptomyces marincola]|uniref:Uncharacterized protein n=1 Tax=Streptomyces marincola TaxID=2878388 RepID=A0A1W7D0L0_9ACTN|nr:hypothetical protein [Streptomyces marincola]ARQ70613.1 hypothetical protein CAG99_18775 [Streptomyces marincola]
MRGDTALLDALPRLGACFSRLPVHVEREIYGAFRLRVRYDGRDRSLHLQVTISETLAADVADITAAAHPSAAPGAGNQPSWVRPRQEPKRRAGRAKMPPTCDDALILTHTVHVPKTRTR